MDEHVDSNGNDQESGGSRSSQSGSAKASRVMRIKPNSRKSSKKQLELKAVEERLEARIQDEVEKRFQSAKDKRWAELERQYGELRSAHATKDSRHLEPAKQNPQVSQVRRILQHAGDAHVINGNVLTLKKLRALSTDGGARYVLVVEADVDGNRERRKLLIHIVRAGAET